MKQTYIAEIFFPYFVVLSYAVSSFSNNRPEAYMSSNKKGRKTVSGLDKPMSHRHSACMMNNYKSSGMGMTRIESLHRIP